MTKQNSIRLFFLFLFLLLCYFPLFLHLDQLPLRLWDEGRRAVNAFEMAQNGNFLVTHYAGEPEMWGTKPPLLIWCQVFWIKLLGYTELAIRMPAAIAGLGTLFVLILFSWKVFKKPMVGFFAALVLLSTRGFISEHMTRSGDFDALLTLWETSYLLLFFVFLEKIVNRQSPILNPKWLYLTALFITLAAFTKSIAGFFFAPTLILYAIFRKKLKPLLISKHTWFAGLGILFFIGGFYFLREMYNPGYIEAAWENDMGGRYFKSKEGHNHPWYLYFKIMYQKGHFMPWIWFLPLGIFVGLFKKGITRNLTILILINVVLFFSVLMYGQTKIQWYVAPIYPCLALLIGLGFNTLFEGGWRYLNNLGGDLALSSKFSIAKYLFLSIFVLTIFFQPYQKTIDRIYFEKLPDHDWKFLKFRDFMERNDEVKNYTIVHRYFNSHVQYYRSVRNLNGYKINAQPLLDFDLNKYEFGKRPLEFQPSDTLMVCEKKVFPKLDKVYEYEVLNAWDTCKILVIK